ncbi:head-to-tail connector [Mycobacterium phage Phayonce]|uniref:Uncharacterized protein n=1 Tax=Mycobacterium phage Phayonce TaxID=1647302 RepID=A0A0F6YRR8_9CAUD|nr:head-to-tail connector [Mycobacterium phage Phayonce]AKF14370.1 hypothetical protein SEA_PHAYONCE_10 [Mycobacterium phage Phayonce]
MQYNISDELVVIRDGAAVHYTRAQVGQSIELTDAEAAPLLADGKVKAPGPYAAPEVFTPTGSVEMVPEADELNEPVDDVEAEPARRGRRRGQDTDED